MSSLNEKFDIKLACIVGLITWLLGLICSMIYMPLLGIDPQNETFTIDHPKYYQFEFLMIPTAIIFGIVFLSVYFKKSTIAHEVWLLESILTGFTIMILQFILDVIVIIFLFQSPIDYFFGLVTLLYLTIPLWSIAVGWFWRIYKK